MQGPVQEGVEAAGSMVDQGAKQNAGEPFDSTEIRQGLRENVPPKMREAYDKVVSAGMKIMFDKKTHHLMQEQMQGEGPVDDRLAEGVAALMGMMLKNSKGAFPEHLIIPAGIELMLHAADFAAQAGGERIDGNTMGSAIQKFIFNLFSGAGVKPEMLMAGIDKIEGIGKGGAQQGQPAPQDGQPQGEPPSGPPPQGGLLSQMQQGAM